MRASKNTELTLMINHLFFHFYFYTKVLNVNHEMNSLPSGKIRYCH